MDVFGTALLDFQNGKYSEDILTYSSLDQEDIMPIPYLFRDFETMPELEQKALKLCKGKVLDVGCGAGSHSLYLQKRGLEVTALDLSEGAIATCKQRGVENCICSDIMNYDDCQYDTILLLMNGIGLAEKLHNLDVFLSHLKELLKPNGQILLDSSDIIYMYEEDINGGRWIQVQQEYYGEVTFTMSYKGKKSSSFSWLYLDQKTLQNIAVANQFNCEIVSLGEHYDYLARLFL